MEEDNNLNAPQLSEEQLRYITLYLENLRIVREMKALEYGINLKTQKPIVRELYWETFQVPIDPGSEYHIIPCFGDTGDVANNHKLSQFCGCEPEIILLNDTDFRIEHKDEECSKQEKERFERGE